MRVRVPIPPVPPVPPCGLSNLLAFCSAIELQLFLETRDGRKDLLEALQGTDVMVTGRRIGQAQNLGSFVVRQVLEVPKGRTSEESTRPESRRSSRSRIIRRSRSR